MGLLDEAIKDHLELKRRHGADPGEVARLEHEALGPARREPVAEEEVAHAPVEEGLPEPVAAPEPPPEPALAEDDYEADQVPAEERLEAPVRHVELEPEPEPEETVEQPTAQFSLEELEDAEEDDEEPAAEPHADVVPADEEPEGDDVLEETPEFLQETPEHDRLWFEQKPPRDFDF